MSWQVQLRMRRGDLFLNVELDGDMQSTAIIGPNGAGKSTVLRTIAGAIRPDFGRIRVGERLLLDTASGVFAPPEVRQIGYVPQGHGLFPHLSVVDNVAFGRPGDRAAALETLSGLGCAHLAERMPAGLSGGERQRVALARALMVAPQLLLLDEPLAALDATARRRTRRFLAAHLRRQSVPAIVVTHDVRDVVALDAVVIAIEGGRVVQRGPAALLRQAPATPFVAEFFDV
ncbi:MAG: ATP-binding cassette domain-containing protein [Myxococcota bacterium]